MQALQVNPVTGYTESGGDYTFNSKRKLEFLRIASEIVRDHHEWPNVGDLCRAVGINERTFYNHVKDDEKFAEDWRNLELHGEATCLSDAYAMRKKNPMYMFGWLRARFPEKYDPSRKVTISVDTADIKRVSEATARFIDAEIVK